MSAFLLEVSRQGTGRGENSRVKTTASASFWVVHGLGLVMALAVGLEFAGAFPGI